MSGSDKEWSGRNGSFPSDNLPYTNNSNNQESISKDIQLILNLKDQQGDPGLIGLKLTRSESFLNLVKSMDDSTPPVRSDSDKLKASNFPATFIKIGDWLRTTRNEGDLTAKLYYAKRKLVWEVLDGSLKSKIEIQWSDIIAIRAIIRDNEPGILEIELHQPPAFFREIDPQPRKHTLWQQASDFTEGQAPTYRRHCVGFKPGILDRHYEQLLLHDQRLLNLSHKPFPINDSPYFDPQTVFVINQRDIPGPSSSAYNHPQIPLGSFQDEFPFQTAWENMDNNFHAVHHSDPYQNYQSNLAVLNYNENQLVGDQSPQVSTGTNINNDTAPAFPVTPHGQYMIDDVYSLPDLQQSNNPFLFPGNSINGDSFSNYYY